MPTKEAHLAQYRHNFKLLSEPVFDLDNSANLDWVITIIFYCAVHLVEKVLAESSVPYDSANHENRFKAVLKEFRLKKIATQYKTLYEQSIRARYECSQFKKSDVECLMKYLEDIKKIAQVS